MQEPKNLTGKIGYIEYDYESLKVLTNKGIIKIGKGNYKLVFGIPRKMWPVDGGLFESYEYELKEKLGMEKFQSILDEYKEKLQSLPDEYKMVNPQPFIEAYEIEGYFDPDGCYWREKAKMKIKDPLTGIMKPIELPEWIFRLYEGDKLYSSDGTMVLFCEFANTEK